VNASKENAKKARRLLDMLCEPDGTTPYQLQRARVFLNQFLDAAECKLPSEAAFERAKSRK
jgi:hypothetical protein